MERRTGVQRVTAAVLESPLTEGLLRLPPVAWIVQTVTRMIVRRQVGKTIVTDFEIEQTAARDIQSTLEAIVRDVVHSYGYVSAMVATLDPGDALTMRAFYVDPQLINMEQIHEWEQQMSRLTGINLSFTDPQVARVYRYKPEYQENLSVKATQVLKPVVSDSLFSLFTPIIPPIGREFIQAIQAEWGIQQVIAIPFFVGDEVVGNLFAIKKDVISEQDQTVLAAFGRQAAVALENERRRLQVQVMQELVYKVQANLQDEVRLLEYIVEDVVKYMGYVGAMVATYESDGSLPVKAFYIDPAIADLEKIHVWENQLSNLLGKPISISDPEIACVYTNDAAYSENLSIKAAKAGEPVLSDELFSLFVPIVPDGKLVREVVSAMQTEMGIQQAIAVPFFLGQELVGNLFAATRSRSFSRGEIAVLKTFGQQAAAGIRNARLYRISNERREIAQIFAKMAFSAAASVHDLRNHIGVAKSNIEMFKMFDKLPPEGQKMVIDMIPRAIERLADASNILDHLHQPWAAQPDKAVDVNDALRYALRKVSPEKNNIQVEKVLADDLPEVYTSPDMLIEAFRILIKNAMEAVVSAEREQGQIRVTSRHNGSGDTIEVTVQDNGTGIKPENLNRVFEMRWTTKPFGMGFGLFWLKDYIDGLKGQVKVSSVVNEGTTFQVILPVERTEGAWINEPS